MDPLTIAASVTKITSTCITTGKTIYGLTCRYQDAPRSIVAISTEAAVISASLSHIQALILSKPNPEQLLRARPEIAATLDTSPTGCMVLFSCLDEELRQISKHAAGRGNFSWRGKARTVWKHETIQELLVGIRGQQSAMNTLIQLLQMESLSEITQLLKQKAPELRANMDRTTSLRRTYPSVRVAESLYDQDDRMSIFSAAESMMAPSEQEFDFDDTVINSTAYRRVLATARYPAAARPPVAFDGDLIDFSDHDTLQQVGFIDPVPESLALVQDLLGLQFSEPATESNSSIHMSTEVSGAEASLQILGLSVNTPSTPQDGTSILQINRKPVTVTPKDSEGVALILDSGRIARPQSRQETTKPTQDSEHLENDKRGANSSPKTSRSPRPDASGGASRQPALRICAICGEGLLGQFVRALGNTYHLECLTCKDCGKVVASKFFPVPEKPPYQFVLCETDFFRRLDLLCGSCGTALRGSYISALGKRYHADHFTCDFCSVALGEGNPYYEAQGKPYCYLHYVNMFAIPCTGCELPIVKQYVETQDDQVDRRWHPECYMIHNFWNVKTLAISPIRKLEISWIDKGGCELDSVSIQQHCDSTMAMVFRIWETLSSFEEETATCISEALLGLNEGRISGFAQGMSRFLSMVSLLFTALESASDRNPSGPSYSREAKLCCEKAVALIDVAAEHCKTGLSGPVVTKEVLSIVTGLAHYVKLLIRVGLKGSMSSLGPFLDDLSEGQFGTGLAVYRPLLQSIAHSDNLCALCNENVGGVSVQSGRVPTICYFCDHDFDHDIKLQQFAHLVWAALARLILTTELDWDVVPDKFVVKGNGKNKNVILTGTAV